jgi:hypothetical protein
MEDEIVEECGKHGRVKKFIILVGKVERRGQFGDVAVDGRIILKYIL